MHNMYGQHIRYDNNIAVLLHIRGIIILAVIININMAVKKNSCEDWSRRNQKYESFTFLPAPGPPAAQSGFCCEGKI